MRVSRRGLVGRESGVVIKSNTPNVKLQTLPHPAHCPLLFFTCCICCIRFDPRKKRNCWPPRDLSNRTPLQCCAPACNCCNSYLSGRRLTLPLKCQRAVAARGNTKNASPNAAKYDQRIVSPPIPIVGGKIRQIRRFLASTDTTLSPCPTGVKRAAKTVDS